MSDDHDESMPIEHPQDPQDPQAVVGVLQGASGFLSMRRLVTAAIDDLVDAVREGLLAAGSSLPEGLWDVPLESWENGVLNAVDEMLSNDRRQTPETLQPDDVAHLLSRVQPVVRIAPQGLGSDDSLDMLAVYDPLEGVYDVSADAIPRLIDQVAPRLGGQQVEDALRKLRRRSPRVVRCQDPNLVAVANGIFDHATKELRPFSPDLVFTAKAQVAYVADPPNPVLHHADGVAWDVESWMASLSPDPEVVELLWQVAHAAIRPTVRWDKVAFLHSSQGNNGKGTFCQMLRNLLGPRSVTSIQVSDFGKEFALAPLAQVSTIITDENDVGTFTEKMATWKAVTTGDAFLLNRKYRDPVVLQFTGFQIQCFNEIPRFRDRSPSLARRILLVPMTACFTGVERKDIKSDFLARTEVLEYVLHRLLHMDVTSLSSPAASRDLLEEFKVDNDPVREFWSQNHERFAWDALPNGFVYEAYRAWSTATNPGGHQLKHRTFTAQLREVIADLTPQEWTYQASCRPAAKGRMDAVEPMVARLENQAGGVWGTPDWSYTGAHHTHRHLATGGCADTAAYDRLAERLDLPKVTSAFLRTDAFRRLPGGSQPPVGSTGPHDQSDNTDFQETDR